MKGLKPFLLLIFVLLMGCAQLITPNVKTRLVELKPGQYSLDPEHAALLFKVDHMGLSSFVGRFERFDASLRFDPDNIQAAQLEAVIDMASINVANEAFERSLRGGSWFNVEKYPQAHYRTHAVTSVNDNTVAFSGELTFLGVSHPLAIQVDFRGGATNLLTGRYTLGFSASSEFNRSDFGLDNYIPAVGDKILLEVHAEFQRN